MTDVEAVQLLTAIYNGWERWNPHNDSLCSRQSDALKQAIIALRSQAEREKGCSGCIHRGEYENEIEYGYPCPCLLCSRRNLDNYRYKPKEGNECK